MYWNCQGSVAHGLYYHLPGSFRGAACNIAVLPAADELENEVEEARERAAAAAAQADELRGKLRAAAEHGDAAGRRVQQLEEQLSEARQEAARWEAGTGRDNLPLQTFWWVCVRA